MSSNTFKYFALANYRGCLVCGGRPSTFLFVSVALKQILHQILNLAETLDNMAENHGDILFPAMWRRK